MDTPGKYYFRQPSVPFIALEEEERGRKQLEIRLNKAG
jgi:hypothetical protein